MKFNHRKNIMILITEKQIIAVSNFFLYIDFDTLREQYIF